MPDNIQLLVHNIVSIASAVALLGMTVFTYLNGPRKRANLLISLTLLAANIFVVSHVIGVNIADPDVSRKVLMFNLANFFIGVFHLHATLVIIGAERKKRVLVFLSYSAAIFFTMFFAAYPYLFLLPSVPKMYFQNYYQPGTFNWLRVAFLHGIYVPLILYFLIAAYRRAASAFDRNKYWYLIVASAVGYGIGFIPNFLVYDWPVNPLWGMFFAPLFAIPLVYGMVRYKLFDVEVVAKQAFGYSVAVGVVGGFAVAFNYLNSFLMEAYSDFPSWIIPFVLSVVVVTAGVFFWRFTKQTDLLKYEFVEVVTHKFRTPLTQIKWAAESAMENRLLPEESRLQLEHIKEATFRLFELTNVLIGLTDSETTFSYRMKRLDLADLVREIGAGLEKRIAEKKLSVGFQLKGGCFVLADKEWLRSSINIILENAITYTPPGGKIAIALGKSDSNVELTVSDTGIGIDKEDLVRMFAKFFRSDEAKKTDTEGLGIGLYIAREVIRRHRGKLSAFSEGLGKGSVFTMKLPAA